MILIILLISCRTIQKINEIAINELLKLTPPDPQHQIELIENNVVMNENYYFDLVEYIIKTEELKKVIK
jgi:hypothetical protein